MIDLATASGVLLVDKPPGLTSADVTNRLKKKFGFARIGHGGTLDPFATGLLVVLLGEATKAARFLLEGEKRYSAEAALGFETDTGDHTGQKAVECAVAPISREHWDAAAGKFMGFQKQTPPAYSAVKVKGKALYDYARKGEAVEVKEREIQIRELAITETGADFIRFDTACSGGTYIRVLAADICREAGTCGHLRALRRTGSSAFRIADAQPLEELLKAQPEYVKILGLRTALEHLPIVTVNAFEAGKIRQGNLAVFDSMRNRLEKPGYFLLVLESTGGPVAIGNHHPMIDPFCVLERVFDPKLADLAAI